MLSCSFNNIYVCVLDFVFGATTLHFMSLSQMADQQAAMFGECCFDIGDVKITIGTGTFMDINTGNKPHTSVAGMSFQC